MSKLEKAYKNATLLKNKAKSQVNEERLFLNKKGRLLGYFIALCH